MFAWRFARELVCLLSFASLMLLAGLKRRFPLRAHALSPACFCLLAVSRLLLLACFRFFAAVSLLALACFCFTSLPAHLLRSSASTHALHLCPHTSSEALPAHLPHLRSYTFARAPPQELCQRTCSTSLPAHLLRSSASAHTLHLCPRTSSEALPAHLLDTSARAHPQELHLCPRASSGALPTHLLYVSARAPPQELCQRTCCTSLPARLLRSSWGHLGAILALSSRLGRDRTAQYAQVRAMFQDRISFSSKWQPNWDGMVTKRADMSSFAAVPQYFRSFSLCACICTGPR